MPHRFRGVVLQRVLASPEAGESTQGKNCTYVNLVPACAAGICVGSGGPVCVSSRQRIAFRLYVGVFEAGRDRRVPGGELL